MNKLLLLAASAVTLLFALSACPGDSGVSGDDDESPEPTPTPPLVCQEITADPISVGTAAELFDALNITVSLGEVPGMITIGLEGGDIDCPVRSGDDPDMDPAGTATWTGGCTNAAGAIFEGSITGSWDFSQPGSQTIDLAGVNFVMDATAVAESVAQRIEFNGNASQYIGPPQGVGAGARTASFDGEILLMGDDPKEIPEDDDWERFATWFPAGFSGSYSQAQTQDAAITFELSMDLDAVCRSDFGGTWDVTMDSAVCGAGEPSSGTVTMTANGDTAAVDFDADDTCDGCSDWTLNGAAQTEPLCFNN